MIVVMKKGASADEIQHMVKRIESMGLKAHVIEGTERTVIAAIGEKREQAKHSLEGGPAVDDVLPILAPYKVASREVKPESTVVCTGSLSVGGSRLGIIAGPCSVENEEQILSTAKAVKAAGATALRGGAFKPRTSPYSFQGLQEEGVPYRIAVLLDGNALMQALGLPPGPLVGRLLDAIHEAQGSGEITSRENALDLARRLLSRNAF